jgi:nucleoside-diphosphate-sugar epimerase
MPTKILYLGGTGEISHGCVTAGAELGQDITVFNRGISAMPLPPGVKRITGDMNDDAQYNALGKQHWDVVCQFRARDMKQCERDIKAFAGNVGQFVFISSASVYRRPPAVLPITESAPLSNPHSEYSSNKIAIENRLLDLHHSGKMPLTIIRPNHTCRTVFPRTFVVGDHIAWRMLKGKTTISHGDGMSLWTVTRAEDFGRAFAKLLGNSKAVGEAFHITSDEAQTWDYIFETVADTLGVELKLVHVASDVLIRYDPSWDGSLAGDKSCNIVFDNSKVKAAVGGWECRHSLKEAMQMSKPHVLERLKTYVPDEKTDRLMDRVVEDHAKLGR